MKKTLLSSMIIILMGVLGACSSNTSDKTSLPEQSASENETATPVAIEVPDTLGKTYDAVEVMPEFPGGSAELLKYLSTHIKYPTMSQEMGSQGRVIVQFVVDKDGSITNPTVVRGVDAYLDKEAIRVISGMPKWKPGVQNGKKVRVKYTVPVVFRLQ